MNDQDRKRFQILLAAAAVIVIVGGGIFAASRSGDDTVAPVTVPPTAASTPTDPGTTAPSPSSTNPTESSAPTAQTAEPTASPATDAPVEVTTTAPATIPPTTPPTVETTKAPGLELNTSEIDFGSGRAFGYGIGEPIDPDGVIPDVSATLGQPTHDTGWYTIPGEEANCLSGVPTRVIWWGSFSMSFWDPEGVDPVMWTWSVGDGTYERSQYQPPADASSPLATSDGLAPGASLADMSGAYSDFELIGDDSYYYSAGYPIQGGGSAHSYFGDDNGTVTGFGAELVFC